MEDGEREGELWRGRFFFNVVLMVDGRADFTTPRFYLTLLLTLQLIFLGE